VTISGASFRKEVSNGVRRRIAAVWNPKQGNHPSRLFSRATLFPKRACVTISGTSFGKGGMRIEKRVLIFWIHKNTERRGHEKIFF